MVLSMSSIIKIARLSRDAQHLLLKFMDCYFSQKLGVLRWPKMLVNATSDSIA